MDKPKSPEKPLSGVVSLHRGETEIKAFTCPNCGAPVGSGAHACGYCQSGLEFKLDGNRTLDPRSYPNLTANERTQIASFNLEQDLKKSGLKQEEADEILHSLEDQIEVFNDIYKKRKNAETESPFDEFNETELVWTTLVGQGDAADPRLITLYKSLRPEAKIDVKHVDNQRWVKIDETPSRFEVYTPSHFESTLANNFDSTSYR